MTDREWKGIRKVKEQKVESGKWAMNNSHSMYSKLKNRGIKKTTLPTPPPPEEAAWEKARFALPLQNMNILTSYES
jgi:hypothetical protein